MTLIFHRPLNNPAVEAAGQELFRQDHVWSDWFVWDELPLPLRETYRIRGVQVLEAAIPLDRELLEGWRDRINELLDIL